jgi:hypothetical protein
VYIHLAGHSTERIYTSCISLAVPYNRQHFLGLDGSSARIRCASMHQGDEQARARRYILLVAWRKTTGSFSVVEKRSSVIRGDRAPASVLNLIQLEG